MMELLSDGGWLPLAFAGLMGLSILVYVILDGYDLGVGILMGRADDAQKNTMIASIGPFWDANETWLVLGIGLLLVAFPVAHGIILTALYLPTAVLLAGLILRGVSFDFRAKAQDRHKPLWDKTFIGGSLLASLAQGYMLGLYILGFERTPESIGFALLTGLCLAAGYAFIGACWLIWKTEGELQRRAVRWAHRTLWLTALGLASVSIATPLVSERIYFKWFALPNFFFLLPVPLLTAGLIVGLDILLRRLPLAGDRLSWAPLAAAAGVFTLGFLGLAYSFFPYIVPDKLTIWQATSAPESLMAIFIGTVIVLPCILGYTVYAYVVFRGKTRQLTYY